MEAKPRVIVKLRDSFCHFEDAGKKITGIQEGEYELSDKVKLSIKAGFLVKTADVVIEPVKQNEKGKKS